MSDMFIDIAVIKVENSHKERFNKLVQYLEEGNYKVIKLEERTFFTDYAIAEVK